MKSILFFCLEKQEIFWNDSIAKFSNPIMKLFSKRENRAWSKWVNSHNASQYTTIQSQHSIEKIMEEKKVLFLYKNKFFTTC